MKQPSVTTVEEVAQTKARLAELQHQRETLYARQIRLEALLAETKDALESLDWRIASFPGSQQEDT